MSEKKKGITALKYENAVFFVKDVEKSKNFYANFLGQKILMDFGRYVSFEGGFSIWKEDYAINTIFREKSPNIKVGGNNSEIYFESTEIEKTYQELQNRGVEIIHAIREHPWAQRAFRIYDLDKHIVEIGEPMHIVVIRLYHEGKSVDEIAKKSLMPIDFINNAIKKIKT